MSLPSGWSSLTSRVVVNKTLGTMTIFATGISGFFHLLIQNGDHLAGWVPAFPRLVVLDRTRVAS
jgi:hypothetical protein